MLEQIATWGLSMLSDPWVIILLMAIESSFIPFPSEVVVPPAAWLALTTGNWMNFVLVIVYATIGADIGALINYYLSRWLGRPIIYKFANSKAGRLCLLSQEKVEQAEKYFIDHGILSTLIGRLVPAVRQLISIPAGLARMKLSSFLLYTTLGAGAWNTVLALIGLAIHYSFPTLRTTKDVSDLAMKYSHEIGYVILGILVLVLIYFGWKSWRKRQADDKAQ